MGTLKDLLAAVETNPTDVRLLQRLGELYQRRGDNRQASRWFARVAATYEHDGFFLKAVALLNQVLKLDPEQPDIHCRLGELHYRLQLHPAAWMHFEAAHKAHLLSGNVRDAQAIRARVLELALEEGRPPKAQA